MGSKKSDFLSTLTSFCKSNKISDAPLQESYNRFKKFYKHTVTPYAFEKGLEALNKGVIKKLKDKCFVFIKNECPNSYEAFVERYEFITDRFWEEIKAQANHENTLATHKSKIPHNWDTMSFSEKIEFTKNIKNDIEFKAYVMAKDPEIKEYFKNSVDKADTPLDSTEQTISNAPEINPQEMSSDYKSKMPLNWSDMSFSSRVDFAKAIKDEKFKAFVFTQDPKIANYFKHLKNNIKDKSFNLYVTLYSFPANSKSAETKSTLKDFVSTLNKLGRSRLQYLEISEPPLVEIREVK